MTFQRLAQIPWRALPAWLCGNRLRILMYHSISDNPADPHATPPAVFKQHMRSLQSAQVISLEVGLLRLKNSQPLKNHVVITFDDALLDFYTSALPLLTEWGYPVTMFIPTGLVGQTAIWDSYDQSKPLMTWEQMEECQSGQVTFGSHTVHHARLVDCGDAELTAELQISLQSLNERLEKVTPALAYPGGYHDARIRQAAQAAGYQYGLGGASRWGNGSETDLFQLRRERLTA